MLSPTGMQQAKERFNRVIKEHYSNVDSISFNSLITAYINDINKNIKSISDEFKGLDRSSANISKLIIACFPGKYDIDKNRNYFLKLK